MRLVINLALGLIFGFGLVLSGMVNPAKVINFLDVAGTWDPSLAFVMIGAIAVTSAGYALARRRAQPLLEPAFQFPKKSDIDAKLLIGSGLFGIGWGLGGLCPGPALTSILLGATGTLVFVPAMLAGVVAGTLVVRALHKSQTA
jgi:uncharacterized membrane protein YedE/YeeE